MYPYRPYRIVWFISWIFIIWLYTQRFLLAGHFSHGTNPLDGTEQPNPRKPSIPSSVRWWWHQDCETWSFQWQWPRRHWVVEKNNKGINFGWGYQKHEWCRGIQLAFQLLGHATGFQSCSLWVGLSWRVQGSVTPKVRWEDRRYGPTNQPNNPSVNGHVRPVACTDVSTTNLKFYDLKWYHLVISVIWNDLRFVIDLIWWYIIYSYTVSEYAVLFRISWSYTDTAENRYSQPRLSYRGSEILILILWNILIHWYIRALMQHNARTHSDEYRFRSMSSNLWVICAVQVWYLISVGTVRYIFSSRA